MITLRNSIRYPYPLKKRQYIYEQVCISYENLKRKNYHYFASRLPKRERWRAYEEFKDMAAFIDIETTGLNVYKDKIIIIGLYDGNTYKAYIRNFNLNDFAQDIKKYALLITYNGARFDLPFIKLKFPHIELSQKIHIDLIYPLVSLEV